MPIVSVQDGDEDWPDGGMGMCWTLSIICPRRTWPLTCSLTWSPQQKEQHGNNFQWADYNKVTTRSSSRSSPKSAVAISSWAQGASMGSLRCRGQVSNSNHPLQMTGHPMTALLGRSLSPREPPGELCRPRRQLRILKRLVAFQNIQRLLGYQPTSALHSCSPWCNRLLAQAEVPSARRTDTPK
jgi:hypothetical protein